MIFETTNDRGKPLTNLEKTKSFLMYKACVLTDNIGNLTIDPQSANSSKGNNDVLIKISKYFVRAPYKCQNELQDYLEKDEKWTILSIEKRREKIIGFAKKTWCDIGRFGIAKSKEAIEVIDSEED